MGRRNACFARRVTIVRAQASSSREELGGRAAHEDLAPARRFGRALRVVRAFNPDLPDVRVEEESGNRPRRVHRALKRPVQLAAGDVVRREKRHAHRVRAGLHRDARRGLAVAGGVRDLLVPVEQLHALAVDRHLELFALDPAEHGLEVAGDAFHLERVLAVGRELVFDEHPAARAERQAFDVIVLRRVRRHVEHRLRRRRRLADREPADLSGRRQVRFHERRRHRQRAGDVVEAAGRIIGRQELRRVHVQRQQVANGVRVLGAVQPVKARGRQMKSGAAVERVFQPANQRLERRGIRDGGRPSAASGPPGASERLFHQCRRDRPDARGRAGRGAGPPSSAWRCGRSRRYLIDQLALSRDVGGGRLGRCGGRLRRSEPPVRSGPRQGPPTPSRRRQQVVSRSHQALASLGNSPRSKVLY